MNGFEIRRRWMEMSFALSAPSTGHFLQQTRHRAGGVEYHIGRGLVQYICLIGCLIQPLKGYVAVCLALTMYAYDPAYLPSY